MDKVAITFVVPAYNEELSLPDVLESILRYTPDSLSYEVIVADNGSDDNTVGLAEEYGSIVFVDETATVGGLRNKAVKESIGSVLVFLDSDVCLTEAWGKNILSTFQSLCSNPWQVTGSRCGVSEGNNWIERYWFTPLLNKKTTYINSGHLITSRELFDAIGGFDESLDSGEDYEFGKAASAINAAIVNNPDLSVIHHGYPKTLREFIVREIWHGMGDCKSVWAITGSKVQLVSIVFVMSQIVGISLMVLEAKYIAYVFFLCSFGICVLSAVYKHNAKRMVELLVVSGLYYVYFGSRFVSCFKRKNYRANR